MVRNRRQAARFNELITFEMVRRSDAQNVKRIIWFDENLIYSHVMFQKTRIETQNSNIESFIKNLKLN